MIWLVDYNYYQRDIDDELYSYRKEYFKIKSFVRKQIIGDTAPAKTRVFSNGLLRIATLLAQNGIAVRYLHYYMLEEWLTRKEEIPQCVAFSAVCPTVPYCAELCQKIKKQYPNVKVLLGGSHVNVAEKETVERYGNVFDGFSTGFELEAAEKIANRKLKILSPKYVDYSLLPFPLREYAINTFTTMGCPFSCAYCVDGRAPHFTASMNGQLDDMKSLLPDRTLVHFFDSVLGYSQEGLKRVCTSIEETGHNFLLSCDMRADILTPELVRRLSKAGFVEIRLGMESSDEELLQKNERTLSFARFKKQLEMIRENSNLYVALYAITGLPGTTWEIQSRTIEACGELQREGLVHEIKNMLYVPYPMTGVDYAARGVKIIEQDWQKYDRQSYPVYETEQMKQKELWDLYLYTSKRINELWLSSLGFSSIEEVPKISGYYAEYIQKNYEIKED